MNSILHLIVYQVLTSLLCEMEYMVHINYNKISESFPGCKSYNLWDEGRETDNKHSLGSADFVFKIPNLMSSPQPKKIIFMDTARSCCYQNKSPPLPRRIHLGLQLFGNSAPWRVNYDSILANKIVDSQIGKFTVDFSGLATRTEH